MKKFAYTFIVGLAVLSFGAPAAFACATQWTGPYFVGGPGPNSDYNYSPATSCYSVSMYVTSSTVGCSGSTGWQLSGAHNAISTSFTLDSTDPIMDPTQWSLATSVEASSSDSSGADTLTVQVSVYHPNGTWSYYTIYSWNSSLANVCGAHQWGYFTANTGDTIYINISGKNTSGTATLKAGIPAILNNN